jgi:amino acid transporter
MKPAQKYLGVFSIAMLTIVSIDSVRNLPAMALFGSTLIFFFIIGALFFLIPCALVSAELASSGTQHGGVYIWVKNAFGPQAGVLAVWLQWVENIIWYPTILSFIAGTIGYLISPTLASERWFLITVILIAFWGATLLNFLGIKSSTLFSNFCALVGLILPMVLIIGLGSLWFFLGHPLQIHFNWQDILPHTGETGAWVALAGIMLSFCGMEIAAVHAEDVHNPERDYPKALIISLIIIIFTLLGGSLAIALVIPETNISLVAGIMQAFDIFFSAYHLHWILPIVAIFLIIGGMGSVSNWIIAPVRGLQIAANDGYLPEQFKQLNRYQSPYILLLYQALIVTFISSVFLLMPSVNASYWLLTALAAQLYMIMYVLMFAAGIRLRYQQLSSNDGFRIPGGLGGMWVVASAGIIGSTATFVIGFIPPSTINVGGIAHYEFLLIMGLILMFVPSIILHQFMIRRV